MHDDRILPGPRFDWSAAYARLEQVAARLEEIENPSPASLERIFRERSAKYAASRSTIAESSYREVITFSVGDSRFAILATDCSVVASMTELTRLPGVPSFYLGLLHHRGTIFPIIDVRPLLSGKRIHRGDGQEDGAARYAVLATHGQFSIGFAAWEIGGMTRFPLDQIALNTRTDSGAHAISGIGPNATMIIDVDQLLRDARLTVDDMPIITSGNEGERK
jgi:chemotaxis signal transduction protein